MVTRTLIIEDEPITAKWIKTALILASEPDFETMTAGTILEAVSILEREEIDLILLDLHLSDSEDANATFETIHSGFPNTPIVIISADDDLEFAEKLLSCGAQDYLIKPVQDMQTLRSVVRLALRRCELLGELYSAIALLKNRANMLHWSHEQRQSAAQIIFAAELISSSIPHLWRRDQTEGQYGMLSLENMISESLSKINALLQM